MVSLRNRKRDAARVEDDAEPDPPKKTRKGKAAKAQPINDEDDAVASPNKEAAKAKVKVIKAETNNENDTEVNKRANLNGPEGKKKGKAPVQSSSKAPNDKESSAQFAKTNNLFIPVDDNCTLDANFHVYVDTNDDVIYDAALNQTNATGNNNKFYKVQILTNGSEYYTWTRWGRVGENGQSALLGNQTLDDAMSQFSKKFKDKSGLRWDDRGAAPKPGKYVFVERSYEPDSEDEDRPQQSERKADQSRSSSPVKCTLDPAVESLMNLIFNKQHIEYAMADLNYDAAKLPLGKLSKNTITRGYQSLKDLAALLHDPSVAQSEYQDTYPNVVESLSNQYYSFIPHAFGRNRPPIIADQEAIKRELTLLDSLTDLKISDSILKSDKDGNGIHPLNQRYNGLGMREMTLVQRDTDEFINISDYLTKTKGNTHAVTYDVLDIFRIEREGETERFQKFALANNDRRLLWHGSRSTNYSGILSQGLRIAPPEAPASGYMFDRGVYLADMSSKSANYCCAHISGRHALLLLCEAELGSPMQELTDPLYTAGAEARAKGLHSTWGKGITGPVGWTDAGCIHPSLTGVKMPDTSNIPGNTNVNGAFLLYNEYVCYDVAQVRLRYLLRVRM